MNYSLSMDSPFNTVLLSPEGRAAYRIDTYLNPSATTTIIKKMASSSSQDEAETGRVVWQGGRPGTAVVHGHEIFINKSNFFSSCVFRFFDLAFKIRISDCLSSSRTFTALNDQSYKWTFHERSALVSLTAPMEHSALHRRTT